MAIKWNKTSVSAVSRQSAHFDTEKRMSVEHENPDIDKNLTPHNYFLPEKIMVPVDPLTGDPVEVTESDSGMDRDNAAQEPKLEEKDMKFADGIRRLRDRVAEVDAEHPPLRDNGEKRITCVELWTTCPAPIEKAGREDEFFHRVHEEFCNFFGEENVGVSCIHKDEKHLYFDPVENEKRESLHHIHTFVAPYVEWDDKNYGHRCGINGKQFMSRKRMLALNEVIHTMAKEEFGYTYPADAAVRDLRVEQLKIQSLDAQKEQLQGEINQKQSELELLSQLHEFTPEKKKLTETQATYQKRIQEEETKRALAIRIIQLEQARNQQNDEISRERTRLVSEKKKAERERDKAIAEAGRSNRERASVIGKMVSFFRSLWSADERKYLRKRDKERAYARIKDKRRRDTHGRSKLYARKERTKD